MKQNLLTRALLFASVSTCPLAQADPAKASRATPPNIIIFLADDLGAEATGCYGGVAFTANLQRMLQELGPVKTPNIDAFAREGILFRQCFATPVCSPSRAELLTGKYNFRSGFTDITSRMKGEQKLNPTLHPTLASRLKTAGYTTGIAGKWHLGPCGNGFDIPKSATEDTNNPHVRECGFDRQCITGGGHLDLYWNPQTGRYTPDILQEWALRFIAEGAQKRQPFFLYYPTPLPHFPYLPTPLNPDGPNPDIHKRENMYGDMRNFPYLVQYLDKQFGEILAKLKQLGIDQNTLILFAGDNGTPPYIVTKIEGNHSIRWGKATMKDTGAWVPFIVGWKGVIKPGTVYQGMIDFSDIAPTCQELAGLPKSADADGISFASLLTKGIQEHPRQAVHVFYQQDYYTRDEHWKLTKKGELFDITHSPVEEKLIPPSSDTPESAAARKRLQEALDRLRPDAQSVAPL